jgi:hypothetical protein
MILVYKHGLISHWNSQACFCMFTPTLLAEPSRSLWLVDNIMQYGLERGIGPSIDIQWSSPWGYIETSFCDDFRLSQSRLNESPRSLQCVHISTNIETICLE